MNRVVPSRLSSLSARRQSGIAFALFLVLSAVLFGRQAIVDPSHVCLCDGGSDPAAAMWDLVWWPHALVHGTNPFFTHVIWVPAGQNLASVAALPAPSLLMAPVTAAFGPIVAYGLLALLAPALAAWCAFRLCRYVTGRWWASLVGGYIFGFSTYEFTQLSGHLNLVLIFPVPALVQLFLEHLDARISRRRFVAWTTVLLLVLLGTSTEIVLTFLSVGALAFLLALWLAEAPLRGRLRGAARSALWAGLLTCLIASPYLLYTIRGLGPNPTANWTEVANLTSVDPLNYLIPTPATWLGHGLFTSLAVKFNRANFSESGAYLGLPLIAILCAFLVRHRRTLVGRVLFGVLVVVFVVSLGPHLHVANPASPSDGTFVFHPSIPMPWLPISHLPLFKEIAPARLAMYVFLIAAIAAAMWLSETSVGRVGRWIAASVALVLLFPNLGSGYWHARPDDPAFFTRGSVRRYVPAGANVLVFPFGFNGNSMLWQAQTHMYFQMTSGYVGIATPPSYFDDPIARYMEYGTRYTVPLSRIGPELRAFIRRRDVSVIIQSLAVPTPWSLLVPVTLHLKPVKVGGVAVYRIPASWSG